VVLQRGEGVWRTVVFEDAVPGSFFVAAGVDLGEVISMVSVMFSQRCSRIYFGCFGFGGRERETHGPYTPIDTVDADLIWSETDDGA